MTQDTAAIALVDTQDIGSLKDVFEYASRTHGVDSAPARLLAEEVETREKARAEADRLAADPVAQAHAHRARQEEMLGQGLAKSPAVLIGLGLTIIAALMGMSTLFIGMLAAKWLTFFQH